MKQDSVLYDSLEARPLPKWLTDQRDGLNTYQPEMAEMKQDRSIQISFAATGIFVLLAITILTIWFFRKNKRKY